MFYLQVTNEISLRLLSGIDAENLFQLIDRSRQHLRQWLPWVDETKTIHDSRRFIEGCLEVYNNKTGLTAGVFYNNELVGVAGFNELDWKNKIGYIGYWLSADWQGYGIMTRVVRALIDYAFTEKEFQRIDIRAAYENKKSRAIPERLGFKQEGHLRQAEWLGDHYVDHIVYGMLSSEWK
ncbi:MAG TPA: GNAT family protein [Bacillota bacterium]|nr:GNAT family protein [Bacillota bacterium]